MNKFNPEMNMSVLPDETFDKSSLVDLLNIKLKG